VPSAGDGRGQRLPWVPRGSGRQKGCQLRRLVVYVEPALYARLQTAAWVRARRRGTVGSLGSVVRDVLDAVLPAALPVPQSASGSSETEKSVGSITRGDAVSSKN
jgi:hypothetical protein